MVKLYCDKCKKEIKDKYYTINFNAYDTNPKYNHLDSSHISASAYVDSRNDVLRILNSQKMYCQYCKDGIESYLYSNYDNTDDCSFI